MKEGLVMTDACMQERTNDNLFNLARLLCYAIPTSRRSHQQVVCDLFMHQLRGRRAALGG